MTPVTKDDFRSSAQDYINRLNYCFSDPILDSIEQLCLDLNKAWIEKRQVFICGNGGSAANAVHMANDFHYGIGACGRGPKLPGLRVEALSSNIGIITCLANDTGYANVFSHQLEVKANPQDVLIVLSGSGNSPNIVNALGTAKLLSLKSFAIVAYDGGKSKEMADVPIHFDINDMQIAEDTQLIVGHMCMQWLNLRKPNQLKPLRDG